MFYHVLIETNEKIGKDKDRNKRYFELNKTDISEIKSRIIMPFLRKNEFQFDGYFFQHRDIKRISIKETNLNANDLSKYENDNMPSGVIMYISPQDVIGYDRHSKDITVDIFEICRRELSEASTSNDVNTALDQMDKSKVFIVHGRDDLAKNEVARFIVEMGFKPIILHEQVSAGKTIIEKIEEHTNVGFAVVLYTPCDVGGLADGSATKSRARQNVVFEHGYLIAKLRRGNVCALVKGDLETPGDISGIVYVPMDLHGAWKIKLAQELRNAKYDVDMNKVI